MKELNVREMRAVIGHLEDLVDEAGEIIVRRRGRAIARTLPAAGTRHRSRHADLRARTPPAGDALSRSDPRRARRALTCRIRGCLERVYKHALVIDGAALGCGSRRSSLSKSPKGIHWGGFERLIGTETNPPLCTNVPERFFSTPTTR